MRRVLSILLVALGRPVRHGCWTTHPEWGKRCQGMGTEKELRLPKFDYHLDETDPDVAVLRRQDGTFVAAFSARGATREGLVEAAEEDYAKPSEANAPALDLTPESGHRKRSA